MVTVGGKCCWRSLAVARVFALVMVCRINLFVTNFSGYAKTVTPLRAGLCRYYYSVVVAAIYSRHRRRLHSPTCYAVVLLFL